MGASGLNVPSPKPLIKPLLSKASTKATAQCPVISAKLVFTDIGLAVSSTVALSSTKPLIPAGFNRFPAETNFNDVAFCTSKP